MSIEIGSLYKRIWDGNDEFVLVVDIDINIVFFNVVGTSCRDVYLSRNSFMCGYKKIS